MVVSPEALRHAEAERKFAAFKHAEAALLCTTGYTANLALSHDKSAFYVGETYWSRGSRGDRVDVVTTYDAKTLFPTGEVILPNGRFLVVPKKNNLQLTTDGRYLLSFNMDPGFGLSVVDLQEKRYVGEIETGGGALDIGELKLLVIHVLSDTLVLHSFIFIHILRPLSLQFAYATECIMH